MEESILKSDIFFFVSTISIVLVTILIIIALMYGIKILSDAKRVMSKVKEEGEEILKDAHDARIIAKEKFYNFFGVLPNFLSFRKKKRQKKE